ncbi:MAG: Ribonuclease HII [Syntrophaceae bacterium PtaB.Bin038]|nr:MAG: Ribonuclease HII [Syntrophaceae bacterium PtaB.Bin038]
MDSFELSARKRGYRVIAGVDEAGRGPLAGPVVAAAVVLPPDFRLDGLRDSKQLTEKKRRQFYEIILGRALSWGLGVVEPSVIDRINIFQATRLAMTEAVQQLSPAADYLLIDGARAQRLSLPITQETVIRGDSLSRCIACASVIAKVSRDRIMEIYHHQFPQYNFIANKGYGTREHLEAIRCHGPCKLHRRSFKGVKETLDQGEAR